MEVQISGSRSSLTDWHASNRVPVSDLPVLTPEEIQVARKLGIREEDYARSLLADQLTRVELERRALQLGTLIEKWHDGSSPKVSVSKVALITFEGRFRVELKSGHECATILLDEDDVGDLFDFGSDAAEHKIRRAIELALAVQTVGATA